MNIVGTVIALAALATPAIAQPALGPASTSLGITLAQGQVSAPTTNRTRPSGPNSPTATPLPRNTRDRATSAPVRPYVGEALLSAPLGVLPTDAALLTYTRELLAPAFAGLTLSVLDASTSTFRGMASGQPNVTVRWWDLPDAGSANTLIYVFMNRLNAGCYDNGMLSRRAGSGAYAEMSTATCPSASPPFQFVWLFARDNERSRLLLIATPSADNAVLLPAAARLSAALGMLDRGGGAVAASPQAAPASPPPVPTAEAPRPAAPAASAPREVQTTRGLLREKPFSVSYPADLMERDDGISDLGLVAPGDELQFKLEVRPASPYLSVDLDANIFGDGAEFIESLRSSFPGAALIAHSILRLPAGPAHLIHFTVPANGPTPARHTFTLKLYDSGREYELFFTVRESALERRRDTIGFILANFSTTSVPHECCAGTIAVP